MSVRSQAVAFVVSLLIAFSAAAIGGFATSMGIPDWYPTLSKPSWTPPSWLFGPVWTLLYTLMGWAAWLVWRAPLDPARPDAKRQALGLYLAQLALNALWSWLFFGWRMLWASSIEILFLWVMILFTIVAFAKVQRAAAWMLVPYWAWVTFATALTIAITLLNR